MTVASFSYRPQIEEERRVVVSYDEHAHFKQGEIACVYGRDIRLDDKRLRQFCCPKPSEEMIDLMVIASAIVFADRTIGRRRSLGWSRNIHISIPVNEPKLWKASPVYSLLVDDLSFLTGDKWTFAFSKRLENPFKNIQEMDVPEPRPHLVMPFSNGLDSYALLQKMEKQNPEKRLVLVTAWNHSQAGSHPRWIEGHNRQHLRIIFPFKIYGKQREVTYRTRAFLFCVLAGITAILTKCTEVFIPENGQGSLGPSLVLYGEEAPYRNTHPGHTMRMSKLIQAILNHKINFVHPFLFQTKGQVLKELSDQGLLERWGHTRSCSKDARQASFGGRIIQCGVCGNCLLRRLSLHKIGLTGQENYLWNNLDASSLSGAALKGANVKGSKSYEEISTASVSIMESLARKADANLQVFQKVAFEAAYGQLNEINNYASRITKMVKAHKQEWQTFLEDLPEKSWIKKKLEYLA